MYFYHFTSTNTDNYSFHNEKRITNQTLIDRILTRAFIIGKNSRGIRHVVSHSFYYQRRPIYFYNGGDTITSDVFQVRNTLRL